MQETNNILAILDNYLHDNPDEIAKEMANDFRKRRIEKNLTREQVADKSGVAVSNITRFEQKGLISLKNLIGIAIALDYSMKKLLFIIFLMVFSFAITANAKKPKVVWPKAVLTLKDGTVLNGYLQNDIHFMKKNIYFSETQNGKDVKYKIVDIDRKSTRLNSSH